MATVARPVPRTLVAGAGALLAGALLLGVALENYLLFHALVEMAAVGVAFALFILVWSSRPYLENAYFLVLGIGLLFVGGLTLLHALAYDGMEVFAGSPPGLPSQLWVAGGLLAAATAVGAPLAIGRDISPRRLLVAYAAATAALLAAIMAGVFPDVNAAGLTASTPRLGAEIVIMAGLAAGMLLLYRRRAAFDEEMLRLLLGALGSYLIAEVCFALSPDTIGPLNLAGHLVRLLAYYLFALAIVEFGIRRPYSVLFRELSNRTDELREAREYVEGLLEQAPGPILVLDAEGRITRLNRAFVRLTGRPAGGLVGRLLVDVLPGIAPTLREAGAAPEGVGGTIVHRDGTIRNVYWTAATLLNPDGTVAATIIQGQDITARVEAELRLRAAIDELEVSNEGLERYAYVASHDLQEPIRTVVSHVQLLQRRYGDQLDEDADEILGYIVEGGLRMQRLVQDLLLLSRIGAKKRPFEPVDIEQVLLDVLRDHRHQIRELGAVVQHDPLPVVCGDPAEMPLIFSHLLQNSLKFRSDEPPRIRITAERDDGWWRFAFADNGIGIEPEYFDRIFVLFQRLHTRERYAGTGVGLPIVKKVVERHGGRCWVTSTPGAGTTFFFTLPDDRARPCLGRSDPTRI
ncbi:MAG: MASE3 domain-containing protein [Methanospirillum sp.]